MQWLLLLSFCLCIIMIYSFKISPKWYNFVFSRQNYTENRWRCIGRIWLGILKKYFAWKLCIMKVCYGPNISSVWKSSMRTILHGFLADWLLKARRGSGTCPSQLLRRGNRWPELCQIRESGKEGTYAPSNFFKGHCFACAPDLRDIKVQEHHALKLHRSTMHKYTGKLVLIISLDFFREKKYSQQ